MASSRWTSALVLAALFVAAISVAQAQTPDAAGWLAAHNAARATEGVNLPPLTWNTQAYEFALAWGQKQAALPGCPFDHSGTNVYGENLAWNSSTTESPTWAVNYWMQEREYYSYSTNSCAAGQQCGHYTQVVWRATTSVGCAAVPVPNWVNCAGKYGGGIFFVCSYSPAGNVIGERPY